MSEPERPGDGTKHCVDLCAGKGGLSRAFEESEDWFVTTVDINGQHDPDIQADVLDLRPRDLPEAHVYVAGPPCTTLSIAGNQTDHYVDGEPNSQLAQEHVALAYHIVGLIRSKSPEWWFLENPRGRMRRYLGQPTGTVTLCQYGLDWQKPTDLWGRHPPSFRYRRCSPGDGCHVNDTSGFDSDDGVEHTRDASERARMPREFSEAILDAVENPEPAYANPQVIA